MYGERAGARTQDLQIKSPESLLLYEGLTGAVLHSCCELSVDEPCFDRGEHRGLILASLEEVAVAIHRLLD